LTRRSSNLKRVIELLLFGPSSGTEASEDNFGSRSDQDFWCAIDRESSGDLVGDG